MSGFQMISRRLLFANGWALVFLCHLALSGCNGTASSEGSVSQGNPPAPANEGNAPESSAPEPDAPAAADQSESAHARQAEDVPPPRSLLADWPAPAAAILLSGEQFGHLEPCGCSERQMGGLSRRADLVDQLRARGWAVTGFELGGTVKRNRRQSEFKFDFTRDALNTIGYKGLSLGLEDLRFDPTFLFEAYSQTSVDENFDLPFITANVTFFGDKSIGMPLSYRIVEVGGVRIGVTAVFGMSYLPELFPNGVNQQPELLQIDPPAKVLPGVVSQMQAERPDVMLLLAYAKPDESRELARQFPDFDLVVTAGGPEDPDGQAEPVGDTLLLRVGTKGKNVGIVGVYPQAPAAPNAQRFRFEVVELDRARFKHASIIDDRMREYQDLLERENLLETEEAITHPRGAEYTFVGSEKCATCHQEPYDVWVNSPHHLDAFPSLTVEYAKASDDPSLVERVRVDRIHDPECICCHAAGWDPQEVLRFESGYLSQEKTPHLKGVHCESCHGPASKHVELEIRSQELEKLGKRLEQTEELALHKERQELKLTLTYARKNLCMQCHDHENSPDFDFTEYWEQIEH